VISFLDILLVFLNITISILDNMDVSEVQLERFTKKRKVLHGGKLAKLAIS